MWRNTRHLITWLTSAAIFLSLVCLYLVYPFTTSRRPATGDSVPKRSFAAPKRNVWADLSKNEADQIYDFLVGEWAHLNLTRKPKSAADNFIYNVEVLQPNKSAVLPYLAGAQQMPSRWARIVLSSSNQGKAELAYHAVGPLPVSSQTRVIPLIYPFNSGRNSVPNLMTDFIGTIELARSLAENISDITTELLGAKFNRKDPYDPDSVEAFPRFSRLESGQVVAWLQLFRPGMGSSGRTLLPQGIYAELVPATSGASEWNVGRWFYNDRLYAGLDEFRADIKHAGFLKTPPNRDGPWTDTEDFDANPDGRDLPPPVSIQPLGPRYKLDRNERYVSWFGWTFYLTSTQATGVSLFDVRFKGEPVLYELGLQEALAHYAGDDPMAAAQEFLDCFFGMGVNAFELLPGYDCPAYADYLDTVLHRSGGSQRLRNNVCIFEFTSDSLLSRHTSQYSVTASRNTYLTIRSVSTVGNYDYTIDYILYLDGTIEVKVRASGYIFGAFYANNPNKTEGEYGHRIHDALASSMHDHVISFKVDLDIAGTANDMVRLAVEPATISYPWDQPHTKQRNTMRLREHPVTEEAGLEWPRNSGELFIVYSADKKNAWGERRGYRIVSGTGVGNTPHLAILNSTALGNSARWAEEDLWVLRCKDVEPRGADPLNYIDPTRPLVDFAKLANGESLVRDGGDGGSGSGYDGDLVLYVNVGSHHVPHSGDLPNTLMHTSASSVMFVPHNFADRDPSRETVQGVRLQLKGTKSGGFPGWDPDDVSKEEDDDDARDGAEELRARGQMKKGYKIHKGANYFGMPYREDIKVRLEDLEPDLEKCYHSREIRVSDLGLNGSAAGMWATNP